ncbi:MAG: SulP family inorganic anion transporter [Bacteroidetes bacterium]|nr:MAG: SulP family inorganic anion transporter [Bacteroidota bacterium]
MSLLIMFTLPLFKHKIIKRIPASLLVLSVAIPLGIYFMLYTKHAYHLNDRIYFIDPKVYLVNLPANMLNGITFPVFTYIFHAISIKYIIMFALVGSIESMLTVKAMDGLDPYHRKSDMNRDIMAVGAGNVLAGLIGGLPMIAEVVRSSANISNGAKTRWANFFHGVFLLVFVAFAPQLLGFIPLTALAAMLIFTGYRLASPREFQGMYKIGKEQFLFFFLTMFITLATDLLIGVIAGMVIKMVFEALMHPRVADLYSSLVKVEDKGDIVYVDILKPAVFTNYLGYKKCLEALPKGKKLIINFAQAKLIDHTFRENLHNFEYDYHLSGGTVELEGLDYHAPLSEHPLAMMCVGKEKHEKQINLSIRQADLQAVAQQQKAEFHPEQMYNHLRLKIFPFFKGAKIKKMQNRIIKRTEHAVFETCDVAFIEADLTLHSYEMSILLIHHTKVQVPDIQLQKEGLVTRYMKNNKDIDFDSHPQFSRFYFLQGKDEVAVREFFTDDLLSFLEHYTEFEIEIRHNVLLVHGAKRILSAHETVQLLQFGEKLMTIINHTKELAHA